MSAASGPEATLRPGTDNAGAPSRSTGHSTDSAEKREDDGLRPRYPALMMGTDRTRVGEVHERAVRLDSTKRGITAASGPEIQPSGQHRQDPVGEVHERTVRSGCAGRWGVCGLRPRNPA